MRRFAVYGEMFGNKAAECQNDFDMSWTVTGILQIQMLYGFGYDADKCSGKPSYGCLCLLIGYVVETDFQHGGQMRQFSLPLEVDRE